MTFVHQHVHRTTQTSQDAQGISQSLKVNMPPQVEVAHSSGAVGEALCRRAQELDAQAVVMAR